MRYSAGALILAAVLTPCPAAAADKADVERSIERGVDALRKMQSADGYWEYSTEAMSVGATALAGLTLLECGAAKDDAAVNSAARFVRRDGVGLRYTYSIALSMLFLDRLGDPADEPLIASFAARLMAGQCPNGSWDYECPDASGLDQRTLVAGSAQDQRANGRAKDAAPRADNARGGFMRGVSMLRQRHLGPGGNGTGDNSITQFATLALWVARRHGLPVESSLRAVDKRFRTTQNPDGGWAYSEQSGHFRPGADTTTSTPTMICSGLLGLGVGYGIDTNADKEAEKDKSARNPSKDRVLQAALRALGRAVGLSKAELAGPIEMPRGHRGRQQTAGRIYYFLWGLERVAVALNLTTIGNKDWYAWGCDILLGSQRVDGAWAGSYPDGGVDTCFALLFLKRANLAGDLSVLLKGRVQDPGHVVLRSSGVGGGGLPAGSKEGDAAKAGSGDDSSKGVDTLGDLGRVPASQEKPGARGEGSSKNANADTSLGRVPASPEKSSARGDSVSKPAVPATASGEVPASHEKTAFLGDTPSAKLAEALLALPADRQAAEIDHLRDQKGTVHTEALAIVVPYLSPESRRKAREALAERVARMKAETIRDYMHDEEPEIRRAAALACAMKGTKQLVPQLIALLTDREPVVSRAAYAALKDMTGRDFGPTANADDADRKRAAAAWNEWWKTQSP